MAKLPARLRRLADLPVTLCLHDPDLPLRGEMSVS